MGGDLDGAVAIVTGAGRGLGRAHALRLAAEGAAVVVNDLGADLAGTTGGDLSPAEAVVEEIRASGGTAVVSGHDVADWDDAAALVELAVRELGGLDVLVNNAGTLRDKALANMSEEDWDAVVRVHLKGHAAPTRHALAFWRERSREGHQRPASVIHTTSISGLLGNFGQANYAAAKGGIIGLARTVAIEGARHLVRSNVLSPAARTRLGGDDGEPVEGFDPYDPAHASPIVAWLASPSCTATGQILHCWADQVWVVDAGGCEVRLSNDGRPWTSAELDERLAPRLQPVADAQAVIAEMEAAVGSVSA